MNDSRLRLRESQLTSVARKVLEAVPIAESWVTSRIINELARLGMKYSPSIVEGCLNSLSEDGLVKEVHKGEWKRVTIDSRSVTGKPGPAPCDPPDAGVDMARDGADALHYAVVTAKAAQPDLLTRMAALANRLRQDADDLDELALAVAEEIENAKAGSSRFDQLKRLLKDVIQ